MFTMLPRLRKRPRQASMHDLIFSFSSSTSLFRRSVGQRQRGVPCSDNKSGGGLPARVLGRSEICFNSSLICTNSTLIVSCIDLRACRSLFPKFCFVSARKYTRVTYMLSFHYLHQLLEALSSITSKSKVHPALSLWLQNGNDAYPGAF